MITLDQLFVVVKSHFPATLGAIIGAWNKRETRSSYIVETFKQDLSGKLLITILAVFAIVMGVSIGKWVSVALVGYYELPQHVIPVIEFVTALNGIKIVDSVVKSVDKSLDVVSSELLRNKILSTVREGSVFVLNGNADRAQSVVDKLYYKMPDLPPVQFYFMLNKSGLDDAINTLLPPLQSEDLNKYASTKLT